MGKLSARPIVKKFIELNGQSGQFDIKNKSIKVKYFSTFASNSNDSHDSMALLRELKPMRERVKARDISNLDSLLQRDLNDNRVASELIPYLIDERSPVAFFPAILAVLIPKGFLQQVEESRYPLGKVEYEKGSENPTVNYGDLWKLESFKIGEKTSSLGILSIDPDNVDIVVLDGQHRANAFRVVTGTFDTEKNSIYSTFYKGITKIDDFRADLPVTIIWFDNKEETFDPKIISRRLFVDVNNNAKKVSQSRTILLDEAEVSSLMTRFFYSNLADRNKFKTDKFSLFHSDFDLDSDINISSSNVFAITNPQIIYDIHSWFTLGRLDRYSDLSKYSVSREAFRNSVLRFGEIFKGCEFNDSMIQSDEETTSWKRVVIKDPFSISAFEKSYKSALSPVLFNIFDKFTFYLKHFQACAKVESNEKDHIQKAVWEEIFMGGEGLYYTFKNTDLKERKSDETFSKYLSAIDSLEKLLRQERVSLFRTDVQKKVNSAYVAANSKAFQIGLFMAFDYFRENNPVLETYESFIQAINKKSAEDWVIILTDVKQKVINGVDPKKWPAYQNLILRVIQTSSNKFYNSTNFKDSPDYIVFANTLEDLFNAWIDVNEPNIDELSLSTIGAKNFAKWIQSSFDEYKQLFESANIALIEEIDPNAVGKSILKDLVSKIKK